MLLKPALLREKQPVRFQLELGGREGEEEGGASYVEVSDAEITSQYLPSAAKQRCNGALGKGCLVCLLAQLNLELWGLRAPQGLGLWRSVRPNVPNPAEKSLVDKPPCPGDKCCFSNGHSHLGTGGNSLYFSPPHAKTAPSPFPSLEHWCLFPRQIVLPALNGSYLGPQSSCAPQMLSAPTSTTLQTWLLLCDVFFATLVFVKPSLVGQSLSQAFVSSVPLILILVAVTESRDGPTWESPPSSSSEWKEQELGDPIDELAMRGMCGVVLFAPVVWDSRRTLLTGDGAEGESDEVPSQRSDSGEWNRVRGCRYH